MEHRTLGSPLQKAETCEAPHGSGTCIGLEKWYISGLGRVLHISNIQVHTHTHNPASQTTDKSHAAAPDEARESAEPPLLLRLAALPALLPGRLLGTVNHGNMLYISHAQNTHTRWHRCIRLCVRYVE
jgi:hypothetical protein